MLFLYCGSVWKYCCITLSFFTLHSERPANVDCNKSAFTNLIYLLIVISARVENTDPEEEK